MNRKQRRFAMKGKLKGHKLEFHHKFTKRQRAKKGYK